MNLPLCLERQLALWPQAAQRYRDLSNVRTRRLSSLGLCLQYNPARIVSTGASLDRKTLERRTCFLCSRERPQEQIAFDLGDGFDLLVNPFPILQHHFTVAHREHKPQSIADCYEKMVSIAQALPPEYVVFYNGPHSGASAPDHLHMQIGLSRGMPLIEKLRTDILLEEEETYTIEPYGFPITILNHTTAESFRQALRHMTIIEGDTEPRLNVLCLNIDGQVTTLFIPRGHHRPSCYYAQGSGRHMVSPGAIDMTGLVITPLENDFDTLTEQDILDIYREVTPHQPDISVGLMHAPDIRFRLNGPYRLIPVSNQIASPSDSGADIFEGEQNAFCHGVGISFSGKEYSTVCLEPIEPDGTFTLHGMKIGIDFHWQRYQELTFCGKLILLTDAPDIWAVNRLPVEDYLKSVISSEMSAQAPKEFLKAHAVISRSWVMAQSSAARNGRLSAPVPQTDGEGYMKWYDRQGHNLFDVCADDHCQRYQGITMIDNPNAELAVKETFAETLVYEGHLCDARFSKCCGGMTEQFETCWQDTHYPYLTPVRDGVATDLPDLTDNAQAEKWIGSSPISFCSNLSPQLLREVLNDYDNETTDFYRWQVEYTTQELSETFNRKSGIDVGTIIDLVPLERGPSGRIFKLLVKGDAKEAIIGKELEIRRVLSPTHLLSSAFTVQRTANGFLFKGAGWGHGVGLCQTGAAMMGSKGYGYREILEHYYPGTDLGRFY